MLASSLIVPMIVGSMLMSVVAQGNAQGDSNGPLINCIANACRNNETLSELVSKVQTLEKLVANLVAGKGSGGSGSTYVRWGRTECPGNGSDLLYAGFMAGTEYHSTFDPDSGNGGNYLCLPFDPSWNHFTDTEDNDIEVSGVEYSMHPHHLSDISDFFGSNIRGQRVPCSVCHSVRLQVMIPGRSGCYKGWKMEYTGYLVAGYPGYNDGTEYVCLDKRPEHAGGLLEIQHKNKIYLVEANSVFGLDNSYPNGREIACVVCSI